MLLLLMMLRSGAVTHRRDAPRRISKNLPVGAARVHIAGIAHAGTLEITDRVSEVSVWMWEDRERERECLSGWRTRVFYSQKPRASSDAWAVVMGQTCNPEQKDRVPGESSLIHCLDLVLWQLMPFGWRLVIYKCEDKYKGQKVQMHEKLHLGPQGKGFESLDDFIYFFILRAIYTQKVTLACMWYAVLRAYDTHFVGILAYI